MRILLISAVLHKLWNSFSRMIVSDFVDGILHTTNWCRNDQFHLEIWALFGRTPQLWRKPFHLRSFQLRTSQKSHVFYEEFKLRQYRSFSTNGSLMFNQIKGSNVILYQMCVR